MNATYDQRIHKNRYYRRYKISREKVFNVYCNIEQLERLYHYQSSTKSLERIRNEFLLGVLTGLRFSDGVNLRSDKLRNTKGGKVFVMNTKKTKVTVYIPVHPMVPIILEKYGGQMNYISLSGQNKNLKLLFKEAGFTDPVYKAYTKGGIRKETRYEFWQLVSTHTARRSLATNLHLAGISLLDIMPITGHKTIKQLERYICTTGEESAAIVAKCSLYKGFKLRPV